MTSTVPGNGHQEHRAGIAAFMDAPLYDALSVLIRQLYSGSSSQPARVVMVTAANPQSGVSYLCSCIATLVAEQYGSTVLVDAYSLLAMSRRGQLPTREDCSPVKDRQLWLLGSTASTQAHGSWRDGQVTIGSVIGALLREFEFVIIDAPAVSRFDAAEMLSPHVDGSILVVVPHVTQMHEIIDAKVKLTARGGRLLGAIYNSSQHEGSKEDEQ